MGGIIWSAVHQCRQAIVDSWVQQMPCWIHRVLYRQRACCPGSIRWYQHYLLEMLSNRAKRYLKKGAAGFVVLWLVMSVSKDRSQQSSPKTGQAEGIHYGSDEQSQLGSPQEEMPTHPFDELVMLRGAIYQMPRPADEKYAINETRSQTLSVTRDIPDSRPAACVDISYNLSGLPTVSVVIPMYNEAPSILLRTVHSVLSRTPPSLLADVIIVDDMSTNENMKDVLTDYISQLSTKVKILRLKKKAHLIKARMAGAAVAKGDILLFQDGHTEVNVGWAEPILHYIQSHRNAIVQPSVDEIDQWSIDYVAADSSVSTWRGVFLWDMRYAWHRVPDYYRSWLASDAEPYPCPVLVGCSIAVDRAYFYEIGGFDTGLDIYGGEQIELSFRTWMCGGKIVIHPCSHIGHVFKPWMKSDVHWKEREQAIARNSIRLGESWMGSYVSYYYASNRIYSFKQVKLTEKEKAGIMMRREVAKEMKCHNFDWYLDNVLPELKVPQLDAVFYGEVTNVKSSMCLTVLSDGYIGLTADCFTYSRYQEKGEFSFLSNGRLMHGTKCILVNSVSLLELVSCERLPPQHGRIVFKQTGALLTQGLIVYEEDGYEENCLEQITNALSQHNSQQMPQFRLCSETDLEFGLWISNYHFEYNLVPSPLFDGDVRIAAFGS